jgi:ribosomal protein L9
LLECYNNGDFPAQLKRSDNNPLDIDGIPVNLYAYGDKSKLINGDNIEFAFQNLLKTGYGRRFVFSDDKTVEVEERSPADVVKEMRATEQIKKDRLPDRERIRNLISAKKMNSVLTLTDEAMLFYAQVQCEGENFVKTNKGLAEAVQSDMLNRVFKLVKLASIYAFFEEKDKVEIEHMQQAKEIIDESSRVLTEITKLKPLHHRLLERMLEESNPCTNQHFLSYPFIPSGWTKKIEEVIKLTKELSSEKNYLWKEVSRKGVVYYSVTKQDEKTEEILKEVDQAEEIEAEKLNDEQEDLLRLLYD